MEKAKTTERAEQTLSDPGYGESEKTLSDPGYGESEKTE